MTTYRTFFWGSSFCKLRTRKQMSTHGCVSCQGREEQRTFLGGILSALGCLGRLQEEVLDKKRCTTNEGEGLKRPNSKARFNVGKKRHNQGWSPKGSQARKFIGRASRFLGLFWMTTLTNALLGLFESWHCFVLSMDAEAGQPAPRNRPI